MNKDQGLMKKIKILNIDCIFFKHYKIIINGQGCAKSSKLEIQNEFVRF